MSRGRPKKKERDEIIIQRYLAGDRISFLAKEYGVSRQRIDQILYAHNLDSYGRQPVIERLSGLTCDEIGKMYADGKTDGQVSSFLGVDITLVRSYRKQHKIKLTPDKKNKLASRYDVHGIIELYKNGTKVPDIMERYKISINTFHKIKRAFLPKEEIRKHGWFFKEKYWKDKSSSN